MKTIITLGALITIGLAAADAAEPLATATEPAQVPKASPPAPTESKKTDALVALEKKLIGRWRGGPCMGDYTFNANGTFTLTHFTPGRNTLTGTWSLRWDALPPTLVVTCKTSDFKKKVPNRAEYEYLDKDREVKLLELNDDTFVYRFAKDAGDTRYERSTDK